MAAYRAPNFQERATAASEAKRKALAQLRARPVADAATLAAGKERRLAAERADAEKRAAVLAEREERAAAERESKAEAVRAAEAAAEAAAAVPVLTEADRKAARDARYAARKNNKRAR